MREPNFSWYTDERYFERAAEFLPERWTTSPELVKDKRAFAPFTIGMSLCFLGLRCPHHDMHS
jgi:cytochrome P450 family 628